MARPTAIPKFDVEVFARETEHTGRRLTLVPAFDVGAFARGAEVEVPSIRLDDVPARSPEDHDLRLDLREAFLMLNVDGVSSVETVIQISHIPQNEALAALSRLIARGLVVLRRAGCAQTREAEDAKLDSGTWSIDERDSVIREPRSQRPAAITGSFRKGKSR